MEKRRSVRTAVVVCVLVVTVCSVVRAKYGGGQGTAEEPYLIGAAQQLCAIGADPSDWDKHFRLTADIDLSELGDQAFSPIGSRWGLYGLRAFTGVFDGAGHTVSHLTYSSTETYPVGFFAYVAGGAEIRDLVLVAPTIEAPEASDVGALVGMLRDGTITECHVRGGSVLGRSNVGGLIGRSEDALRDCSCAGEVTSDGVAGGLVGCAEDGTIVGCRAEATVTGRHSVGGLVGWNRDSEIESCFSAGAVAGASSVGGLVGGNSGDVVSSHSTAAVRGTDEGVGGLAGYNYGTIVSCWASGPVDGDICVGGFVGRAAGTISHCYATGAVQGKTSVAGFVGQNWGDLLFSYATGQVSGEEKVAGFAPEGSVFLCYWDIETSGIASGGIGQGRTTDQMQVAATFAGWGYESRWSLQEGVDYPRLVWEDAVGELLVDAPRLYGGGTGQPEDPYWIATAEHLVSIARFREDFDKHFRLSGNINVATMDAERVIPIGVSGGVFTGSFEGNGHTISHFTCVAEGQDDVGLFGTVGPDGLVRNLRLRDAEVSGRHHIGALIGSNAGRLQNCSMTGIVEGVNEIGGLVGRNEGQIETSIVDTEVTGQSSVGGLAGYSTGRINACAAAGRVTGQSSVGGLVGHNDREIFASRSAAEVSGERQVGGLVGTGGQARHWTMCPAPPPSFVPGLSDSRITACYSTGPVTGRREIGGLVGRNAGVVLECYAAGPVRSVSGQTDTGSMVAASAGGLVGAGEYGIVHLSYWDMELSGLPHSAGGRGRTTSQMIDAHTFRGWEHAGQWTMDDGRDYPRLTWEDARGDPVIADPARYGGGTGAPDDPYQIWTVEELITLGYHPRDWGGHLVLMDDLDFSGVEPDSLWPIGILSLPFAGTFDGNGHSVVNFACPRDLELYAGLFGSVGGASAASSTDRGQVANLHLEEVDVTGFCNAGGLTGHNAGTISSCSVTGHVLTHSNNAGGLVGYNLGTVEDCVVDCNVTADATVGTLAAYSGGPVTGCSGAGVVTTVGPRDSYVGGLIGENGDVVRNSHFTGQVVGQYTAGGLVALNEGTILNCSARATVSGTYLLGGLVGYNEFGKVIGESFAESTVVGGNSVGGLAGCNEGQIRNCFAGGEVTGEARVGGLVGQCHRDLMFCYSTCSVNGQSIVGGLVGELRWGEIASCFWDVELSGSADGVGNEEPDPAGVAGRTTPAMKMQSTFTPTGWDFVGESENGSDDIWIIDEGLDYPRLVEGAVYDPGEPDGVGRHGRSR